MSPLSATNIMNPDIGLREKLFSWLASQGVSSVLLCGIIYGVYSKSEILIGRIEAGYTRNAAELLRAAEVNDRTVSKLIVQWQDDRKMLIELLRNKDRDRSATGS